jgi:hypothetical protein
MLLQVAPGIAGGSIGRQPVTPVTILSLTLLRPLKELICKFSSPQALRQILRIQRLPLTVVVLDVLLLSIAKVGL